jgi:hypothetical protein
MYEQAESMERSLEKYGIRGEVEPGEILAPLSNLE